MGALAVKRFGELQDEGTRKLVDRRLMGEMREEAKVQRSEKKQDEFRERVLEAETSSKKRMRREEPEVLQGSDPGPSTASSSASAPRAPSASMEGSSSAAPAAKSDSDADMQGRTGKKGWRGEDFGAHRGEADRQYVLMQKIMAPARRWRDHPGGFGSGLRAWELDVEE